ncbi:MAG: GAF domain-containing protein [Alphaproteobacteria bacterium]|nr:GAF domain-containing protein [Alphaproteobacteria bacterium]
MPISLEQLVDLAFTRGLDAAEARQLAEGLASRGAAMADRVASAVRRLSQLVQVVNTIPATLPLDTMLPRMVALIAEVMEAETASLFLHDPESDELFSRVMAGTRIEEIRIPAGAGIAGAVFRSGQSELVPDAYADPRFNTDVDRRSGFRTRDILCVPVKDPTSRVVGVAQALNRQSRTFDQADRAMLEAIAAQAAAALEHARLYESLERARREEAQLLEISEAISSDLQLDTLLGRIVQATTELLDAERATLFLHDPMRDELWSKVATGGGTALAEIRMPAGTGIAGSAFRSGEVENIADAYMDPRFNQDVDRRSGFRTRSILCLPVRDRAGDKLGVMQVLNRRDGPFTPHCVRRLKAFSAQIAIAIANARLFTDVLELKNYNESVLKSLTNGVLTLDRNCRVVKVNDSAARLLRLTGDGFEGRPAEEVFGENNPWIMRGLERVMRSGESDFSADTDLILPGGARASVNLTATSLRDLQGTVIGYMLVFEDITREKRVRSTMSRYMAKEVVDRLLAEGESVTEGTSQLATVLFSDIRRFTSLVEGMTARETVRMLNEYFSDMVEVVFRHGGILDKYIGDAIMATFGAPIATAADADNALAVANEMMRALRRLNARRTAEGQPAIEIGIGLATGPVLAGSIGSMKRMDYTVIGDSVNLAARLEGANKYFGTSVLLAGETLVNARAPGIVREVDLIRVKGKSRPTTIYEALGYHTEETFPNLIPALRCFAHGLDLYRARQWRDAGAAFREALALNQSDRVAAIYVDRCSHCLQHPPPTDWDGVWTLNEK